MAKVTRGRYTITTPDNNPNVGAAMQQPQRVTDISQRAASMLRAGPSGNLVLQHPVNFKTPTAVNQLPPEQASSFFGPQQPLPPIAPVDIASRSWDFPLGTNVQTEPRAFDAVSFRELYALATNCELVRLAIETRKDQLGRLTWNIVPRDPEEKEEDHQSQIDAMEEFFRYPDSEHDWATWLRMLAEQVLVYDAPTLFPQRNKGGKLIALQIVDGSTIKRVIDEWGRTPPPPYPAYQQILKGVPAINYTKDELIYRPRNPRVDRLYGFSPVEQIIRTANIFIRRQLYQLDYFTEGTSPEGFMETPEGWTQEQIRAFEDFFNSYLSGNLAARRKVKFVGNGMKYTPVKEAALSDIYDEWLARVVMFAFSLPATAFTKQVNRATAESQQEVAEEEGLAPLMLWVKNLMDFILEHHFGIKDLVFQWHEDNPVAAADLANINKIYVTYGIKSVDEVRAELGLDPIGMDNAYFMPTGAQLMDDIANRDTQAQQVLSPEQMASKQPFGGGDSGSEGNDADKPSGTSSSSKPAPKTGAKNPPKETQ